MHRINEMLILLLTVKFVGSESGVCFPERKENKCCARYYLTEGNCFPCNGSIGHHCSLPCLRGYCGNQCKDQCKDPCDDCDSQTCVCSNSQESNVDSSAATEPFKYELIFVGLIVLGISLAAFIFWIYKRKKRPLEVNCLDLTQETYVEYDMIRESQLILDDDDLKRKTAQPCDNMDKQRRLSLDDNSEGGFYNELRYNS